MLRLAVFADSCWAASLVTMLQDEGIWTEMLEDSHFERQRHIRDGSYVKDQCRLVNLIAGDGRHTRFEASQ